MKPKKSQRRGYYAVSAASRTAMMTTTSATLLLASASPLSTTISLDEYQHYCVNDDGREEGVRDGDDVDEKLFAAVAAVESLLGYTFHDVRLVEEALTHTSHPTPDVSYQRLEFLDVAVVGLALTNHIFLTNPNVGPDRLTLLRLANIYTTSDYPDADPTVITTAQAAAIAPVECTDPEVFNLMMRAGAPWVRDG